MSQLTSNPNLTCLSGFVVPAEQIGFIQRGTHRLVDRSGRVLAALRSGTVDLIPLQGRLVTVCGINEGQIEGVLSLHVTAVPGTIPSGGPPGGVPGGFPGGFPATDLRQRILLLVLSRLTGGASVHFGPTGK